MIKKTINAWLVTVLMISICLAADNGSIDQEKSKTREEKLKEMIKAEDASIEFYGKLIDQHGDPVEDAQVTIQMSYFSPMALYFRGVKELLIQTDKKGTFELKNITGDGILITKIEKKGYEFLGNKVERNYYYSPGAQKKHQPNKANPVIFAMRKKEPPTYVIPGSFGLTFLQEVEEKEIDLVKRRATEAGKLGTSKYFGPEHADIRIKAKLSSEDKANYNITFSTPNENSGIVERELLYVAPAEGYQPAKILTVPITSQVKKYLYIKSRQGAVYARLDIEIKTNKENVHVSIKSWTNPNSERNVDFDEDYYAQEERLKYEESKRKAIEREERKKLKEQQKQ